MLSILANMAVAQASANIAVRLADLHERRGEGDEGGGGGGEDRASPHSVRPTAGEHVHEFGMPQVHQQQAAVRHVIMAVDPGGTSGLNRIWAQVMSHCGCRRHPVILVFSTDAARDKCKACPVVLVVFWWHVVRGSQRCESHRPTTDSSCMTIHQILCASDCTTF